MAKGAEAAAVVKTERNLVKLVLIIVSVLAGLYFVMNLLALIFPGLGIPVIWLAFPIAPQPPPF